MVVSNIIIMYGLERERILQYSDSEKNILDNIHDDLSQRCTMFLVCQFFTRPSGQLLDNFGRKSVPVGDHDAGRLEVELLRCVLGSGAAVDAGGGGHFDPVLAPARAGTVRTKMSGISSGKCFSGGMW